MRWHAWEDGSEHYIYNFYSALRGSRCEPQEIIMRDQELESKNRCLDKNRVDADERISASGRPLENNKEQFFQTTDAAKNGQR